MTLYPLPSLQAKEVDIVFLIESSYPYILGGVSTWVHQIIENFPQYTFGLIFLGGAPENYKEGIRYKIPPNVTHFQVHYLFAEDEPTAQNEKLIGNEEGFERIKKIHEAFQSGDPKGICPAGDISLYDKNKGVDYEQFLHGKLSWDVITQEYEKNCGDSSFIDYFWTIKNTHKPLWTIANILHTFPKAKLAHSVSTGYAGLLGFLLNYNLKLPLILSEHGIYTKERRVDIFLSTNFRDDNDIDRALTESSYLRNLWDRYFKILSQLCYSIADPIVSLFSAAHKIQLEEGAPAEKAIIIPNGINIERFKHMRRPLEEKLPIVCFVGRLVPMKDVKGFIRAIPNVHTQLPKIKFLIIGSTDQDPAYAIECHQLVENISMQNVIEFKPHQVMEEVLPKVKILVLSAIREGMPFVIIESLAAGVPVVATDVGASKEIIEGITEEDKEIGPAGIVVKVADPHALEQAIVELLTNEKLWHQMSENGIKRVERYYDEKMMLEKYSQIYARSMM